MAVKAVTGSVSIQKPCTKSTVTSYNVGDDIDGLASYSLDIPANTVYKYKAEFLSIQPSANCQTVPGTLYQISSEAAGPISLGPENMRWFPGHKNAQKGVYEARVELSVQKKLNGNYGSAEVLGLQTCIYKVGNPTLSEPRASISNVKPCSTNLKVGEQQFLNADCKVEVLGNDPNNKYVFDCSVKSIDLATGNEDYHLRQNPTFKGGDGEKSVPLKLPITPNATDIGTHRVIAEVRAAKVKPIGNSSSSSSKSSSSKSSSSGTADPCEQYQVLARFTCLYEVIQGSSSSSKSSSSNKSSSSQSSPSSSISSQSSSSAISLSSSSRSGLPSSSSSSAPPFSSSSSNSSSSSSSASPSSSSSGLPPSSSSSASP